MNKEKRIREAIKIEIDSANLRLANTGNRGKTTPGFVNGDSHEEFSSHSCELCNSSLAGERYGVNLIFPGTDIEHIEYSVCVDCYYFVAYGELPL